MTARFKRWREMLDEEVRFLVRRGPPLWQDRLAVDQKWIAGLYLVLITKSIFSWFLTFTAPPRALIGRIP
jgi:hypothetical protein